MALPISAHTALVGLLGDPVRHSLSPAMHNAALAELNLDWIYLALPAPAQELAAVLQGLAAVGCRGLNVTIPHKQAVAPLCRRLTPLAQRLGAVNTLVPLAEGGWLGHNTDVEGFCAPLRQQPRDWTSASAVVLGCGGSARAVVAGLAELGLARIQVVARRVESAAAFAGDCQAWAPMVEAQPWEAIDGLLTESALVVNTTPVGMHSSSDAEAASRCPLSDSQLDRLTAGSSVYDLIYTPRPTRLLQEAARRSCHGIDGLEMLVQQGAASLRLWSERQEVPVAAMRRAAETALGAAAGRP